MPLRPSSRLIAATSAMAMAGVLGCGSAERVTPWIPADAATVRCTTAGRDRMAPVLLDLPVPRVPTGLLARQLDPMALNDMGYEREQPVCAALLRPPGPTDEMRAPLRELLDLYQRTGVTVRNGLGTCACDVARAADVVDLVATCQDQPHRAACSPTPDDVERVRTMVQPLRDALERTPVPRVHWRVAGRTDRPGWIVQRLTELLPRHAGGATVMLPGEAIPSRHNHGLVRRLFDVPGVIAVLRLDGGRSMLVIRELDDALVLDLLSFPRVEPRLAPLLPYIDDARAEALVAQLQAPAAPWQPPVPFSEGNFVHLDRGGLHALDSMLLAMAPLAGLADAPGRLPDPESPPLVDALTLQARFGTKGKVLRARLGLSEAGQQWAQTLGRDPLGTQLELLGLPMELAAAPPPVEPRLDYVAHGTATERLLLDGLQGAAAFMRALEMQQPGAVKGTAEAWELSLPPGVVGPGGLVPPADELRQWTERIAAEAYELRSRFDASRRVLELELAPR